MTELATVKQIKKALYSAKLSSIKLAKTLNIKPPKGYQLKMQGGIVSLKRKASRELPGHIMRATRQLMSSGETTSSSARQNAVQDRASKNWQTDRRKQQAARQITAALERRNRARNIKITLKSSNRLGFEKSKKSGLLSNQYVLQNEKPDLTTFMQMHEDQIILRIHKDFKEVGSLRVDFRVLVEWEHTDASREIEEHWIYPKNGTFKVLTGSSTEIKRGVDQALEGLEDQLEDHKMKGSGYVLNYIKGFVVNSFKLGLNARGYIPSQAYKHFVSGTISVDNRPVRSRGGRPSIAERSFISVPDDDCFKDALMVGLHHREVNTRNNEHRQQWLARERYNWDNIEMPADEDDIRTFERQNPRIMVNAYEADVSTKQLRKIYESAYRIDPSRTRQVIICMVVKGDEHHWVAVKDLGKFTKSCRNHHARAYVCDCSFRADSQAELDEHVENNDCRHDAPQVVKMPEEDSVMCYKRKSAEFRSRVVVIADLEAFLKPVYGGHEHVGHEHIPSAVKMDVFFDRELVDSLTEVVHPGDDPHKAMTNIFRSLKILGMDLWQQLNPPDKGPKLSQQEWVDFNGATNCEMCNIEFVEEGDDEKPAVKKCRDHDHVTKRYRRALCGPCNLLCKDWHLDIPIFFHNMKKYDGQFVMETFAKLITDDSEICSSCEELDVLPENMEKFKQITWNPSYELADFDRPTLKKTPKIGFTFKDTMSFVDGSLENLVKEQKESYKKEANMAKRQALFKNIWRLIKRYDLSRTQQKEAFDLLTQKGKFPYTHLSGPHVYTETQLPTRRAFYDDLREEECKQEDYGRAKRVWELFRCKSFLDYELLYLSLDVAQLADVWFTFSDMCFEHYGLEPAKYVSAPGFGWDAMLKMTGVNLELLTDQSMYEFFEQGKRGGYSAIHTRFSEANNPACPGHDSSKPTKHLFYWDATNLYGWAMRMPLPIRGFKWMDDVSVIDKDWVMRYDPEGLQGYTLEVDLHVPDHLHDKMNAFPMAPHRRLVDDSELSEKQLHVRKVILEKPNPSKSPILVADLCEKKNYVVSIDALQFYLKEGLVLDKVHRGISFEQESWMRPYIDFNTKMRNKHERNPILKALFKLMNNAIFGKTMENTRLYKNIFLETHADRVVKKANKYKDISVKFVRPRYCNKESRMAAVECPQDKVTLNKPIYAGQKILDLAKIKMYDFHYGAVQPQFGDRAKLLFTDTDSLCYEITSERVFEEIANIDQYFDLSKIDAKSPALCLQDLINCLINEGIVGVMKEDNKWIPMAVFVGLTTKKYAYKKAYGDKMEKVTSKGFAARLSSFDRYHDALMHNKFDTENFNKILSRNHLMQTARRSVKTACCYYGTKRREVDGTFDTIAHGHWRTRDACNLTDEV